MLEALVWIAVWETGRIVKQARENPTYDSCFKVCFEKVMEFYPHQEDETNHLRAKIRHLEDELENARMALVHEEGKRLSRRRR